MIERITPQQRIKELLMMIDDPSPAPEVTAELYRILETHPESRAYYIERMHLQSEVRVKLREQQSAISPTLALVMRRAVVRRRLQQATLVLLPMLLLMFGYISWNHWQSLLLAPPLSPPQQVARVFQCLSLHADGNRTSFQAGQKLVGPERYFVQQELLDLRFAQGTRCVIKGPAEFRLLDEHRLFLERGEVVVDTADDPQGFVVQLAGCDVVDIGTRFGVTAHENGEAEVHVFQGSVQLRSETVREMVTSKQAVVLAPTGSISDRMTASVDRFSRSYPLLEGIERVAGDVRLVCHPPRDLRHGAWEQTNQACLFLESQRVLDQDCLLSFTLPGVYQEHSLREQAVLPAQTAVNCFMLHYNTPREYSGPTRCSGTIVFTERILGLIVDDQLLDASDELLGQPGFVYASGENKRGSVEVGDLVEIYADQRTLTFTFQAGSGHLDSLRVLTAARVPDRSQ